MKRKLHIFFILLFLTKVAQAQVRLNLILNDVAEHTTLLNDLKLKTSFLSKEDRDKELTRVFFDIRQMGYLTAAADSIVSDSTTLNAYIRIGNLYQWALLKRGNVDEEILSSISFRDKFFSDKPFSPKELAQLLERIIIHLENNAYPFATINLDSVKIENARITATLNLQKNQYCEIDSFLLRGNAKISRYYIQRQIGIRKGDKYNESRISQISKRLREVPFLKEANPAVIYFSEKYTKLIIDVNEKKANRFDGVLGFMPNETTGKLLITGQLTLKLTNSFNKGEVLDVDWQKLQVNTQNLKARLQIPFLFRSPFGADLGFKLYKRDTLFTDVSENIGLNYLIGLNNFFKVFFINRNIALISTRGLETLTTLPALVDVNSKQYGIGFRTERLDYKFNPRKGYVLEINGSAGTKVVKKNVKLNPIAYDKLKRLKTDVYSLDFMAELYLPIKSRSTLVFGNKSAWTESENFFANELYRIGGMSSLRGFDEESINASAFTISKIEYRFLLDQNSFLFGFVNHAYYQNIILNRLDDNPLGFGVGINFETKPGIFSLSYALGRQFDNPVSIRSAKIHFGIVSTF